MIIGNAVTLIAFDEKYLEIVHKWINHPEVRIGTGSEGPVSDFEHKRWFEQLILDRTQRVFIIAQGQKEETSPVGLVGLKHLNARSRSAEYWIYIGEPEARRKGIAQEATRLIMGFGFNTLNLHRIFLAVLATNVAALAMYRKLGLVHEGTARHHHFDGGEFVDTLYFSMLEKEFRDRNGHSA